MGGGILASVDERGEGACGVRFWDARNKSEIGTATAGCGLTGIAAAKDGALLAAGGDNGITVMERQ